MRRGQAWGEKATYEALTKNEANLKQYLEEEELDGTETQGKSRQRQKVFEGAPPPHSPSLLYS